QIERVQRAPGEAELPGEQVAVAERALFQLIAVEAGVVPRVPAKAGVEADLEATGRAELIVGEDLRPQPDAGLAHQVVGARADRDATLQQHAEAQRLFDAGEAQL